MRAVRKSPRLLKLTRVTRHVFNIAQQERIEILQKQPPDVVFEKGLKPANLLKKRLWYRSFPVSFTKVLRTNFLQNTSGPLLLSLTNQFSIKKSAVNQPLQCLRNLFDRSI